MQPGTGLPGLDKILQGIRPGDNIVWQADSIDDYFPYVRPFCEYAKNKRRKLIYFRFAKHRELVTKDSGAQIYQLYPEEGFEQFITKVHKIIKQTGQGGYYVFDSLSELAIDCYSERMTGNFFLLTCPYLNELNTIAYFTVLKNYHSYHAALPISETTQVLLDIHSYEGKKYVQPIKVYQRHSPTMYMLHIWDGDDCVPIKESVPISDVMTNAPWYGLQSASYQMVGLWDRRFIHAEEILESYNQGECSEKVVEKTFHRQLRQLISHDERILSLAEKYLTLSDIIHIWKRTIGSGFIGGKSVGMLLARAILKKQNTRLDELMEAHDSFYIGSDIFYSFLVQNDCWEIRQKQKDPATLLDGAEEARQRLLHGSFPDYIIKRFEDMLNYFGQTPIIVRSSSLLEDNLGNAFAGKYESVFCANRGTHEQRLDEFINAVRVIYASSMSEEALIYRDKRGVLDRDEQMALLVQRVSGAEYGSFFFPQLAGVGVSFNSYVWEESIDPEAGLLRLVFGLGTRAVDRSDDDYTRVVALNAPAKRPEGNFEEVKQYAQKRMDFLDLEKNCFTSSYFIDVIKQIPELPVEMFSTPDREVEQYVKGKSDIQPRVLTFEKIFAETSFTEDMREMLKILKEAYGCHVDIEFTANFFNNDTYRINLLQCRPYQVKTESALPSTTPHVDKENIILETHGGVIGQSRAIAIDRIIYVVPSVYGNLPVKDRYAVARLIGKLVHYKEAEGQKNIMLLGPGRWGTKMPSLGVPVSFSEINTVSIICEIAAMHERLTPDLSLGTHFFNDMVEMNMLYMSFYPEKKDNVLNEEFLLQLPNRLTDLFPEVSSWCNTVKVIHGQDITDGQKIYLNADSMKQRGVLYIDT